MKWMMIALIFSHLAYAESFQKTSKDSCQPLDLRNETLPTIRDQKKVAWCYAFTAADMLSYTFNLPEMASAADVAINYNDSDLGLFIRWLNQTFGRKPDQGEQETFMMPHQTGFNKIALDRGMRDGYCPERIFPSDSWVKMTREGDKWHESQTDLRSAMVEIFGLIKNQKNLSAKNLPFYFHFKNVESAEDFYTLIKGQTASSFYSKLRKVVCQHDRIKFPKRFQTMMYVKDPAVFTSMNKQLNRGRLVGIDYDSRILSDRTNASVNLAELHTSSVVGRRWNKTHNECQYLIRDSHGNQCARYDTSYECLGGQVWMDESLIYPNLTSLVYIETK
ncbi:MAG: hypothetical protein H0V66_13445 [Bdellovibrionales bacterium]|nr:hypothetical protein [Bdellovibrionales bacterium]